MLIELLISDLINSARADAQRLLRYVRGAPTIDAERKLAAALLVYWEMGSNDNFRAEACQSLQWRCRYGNWRMLLTVIASSIIFSAGSMLLIRHLIGKDLARALARKAVTAPVALGIAAKATVRIDLALVGVMLSGMFGMVLGPVLLSYSSRRGDHPEVGVALGCAAHGLGTARAFAIGPVAGVFASVCMGLSALASGITLPLLLNWCR